MTYNIQLQIAGFSVILILIIIFFSKKRLESLQNKIFSILLIDTLVQLAFDIISVCTIVNRNKIPAGVNLFFSKGYLVTMTSYIYLIDIYALSNTLFENMSKRRKNIKLIIAGLLTAAMIFTIAVIIKSEILFAGEGHAVYSYGAATDIVYIFSGISVGFVILILLINFKHVPIKRQLSFYSFCVMEGSVAIVQMLNKELLIIGFGTAIIVFIMYFELENPDLKMIAELERSKKKAEDAEHEAKEANLAKSQFLAQMSHEIRTPINAVLGMNEMILRESSEPAVQQYASNAYNAGKTLLSIINDILDISKIEAGKLEIVEEPYELYSLVSDCYHLTANRAEKKGLLFKYDIEENLPSKLLGDMFHIRQIIVNFLTNAIKYTDEGFIKLSFSGEENFPEENISDGGFALKVSVEDTGIGLTNESKEKLFASFQRFDLKRNQTVEGTGLGLAICKQLSELMGGTVGAESEYGKGSTFFCVIPQKIVNSAPIGRIELNNSLQNNELAKKTFTAPTAHILVVDDVEMNLTVFKNLVKNHKFQIDEASSGKQCLDLIQKQKYDLIFMDHMMPEMDGIETFSQMKKTEHQNRNTPVVMLTANAISGEKEKYLSEGFTSYLTKPIQSDKLEKTLIQYLPKEKIVWENNEEESNVDNHSRNDYSIPELDYDLLDINLGLSYAGNSESSYFEILESYARSGEEKLNAIKTLCEKEDWKDYNIRVHSLKSTSLTIGSKKLSEFAKELETASNNGDYDFVKAKNGELLKMYKNVLDIGEKVLDEMKKTRQSPNEHQGLTLTLTIEQLSEYAAQIKNAAESFDSDEIVKLCEELSGFSFGNINLSEKIKPIKDAANDFEYEQAETLANEIFGELIK